MANGTPTELSEGVSQRQLAERVTRLGDLAAALEASESAEEIYDHTVSFDEHVLEFDAAIVCTVEDGAFVPRAASARTLVPGTPLGAGDGIAGVTVERGAPVLVSDVREHEAASPTGPYRSALSIPFPDRGVLQFHATDPDSFSGIDREFGELLASTMTNALGRVRYERARNRERDQFAALFENVPDAAVQYRIDGGEQLVEAVNSSFVGVFGNHGEDVTGKPVAELVSAPEDRSEPERRPRAETDGRTDVEVVRETVDGPRPFLLRNVPMRSDDESIRGYLIYTDLTALKARERELERKNERLDQFASMVSHDLRNPLNVAAGYLDLAREQHDCEELAAIERAHERMERLIDDVLSLTRAGDSVDDVQPVHLGTIVREAWDNVSTSEATISVDGETIIEADPGQLLQLLENLFRNSVEHGATNPDSRTEPDALERVESDVSVAVGVTTDGFYVEDDGPGIPEADRDRIFESGYTTAEDNTGLGLAIVDQIRRAHDWDATVEEGSDGGARFEFAVANPQLETTAAVQEGADES